jgi:hypothetical protein
MHVLYNIDNFCIKTKCFNKQMAVLGLEIHNLMMIIIGFFGISLFILSGMILDKIGPDCTNSSIRGGVMIIMIIGAFAMTIAIVYMVTSKFNCKDLKSVFADDLLNWYMGIICLCSLVILGISTGSIATFNKMTEIEKSSCNGKTTLNNLKSILGISLLLFLGSAGYFGYERWKLNKLSNTGQEVNEES